MADENALAKLGDSKPNELALGGAGAVAPYWCSWRATTDADKQKLLHALHGKVESLAEKLGEPIEVTDVLTQRIDVINEATGEVVPSIRLVLIGPDGSMYSCVSEYAWSALQAIASPQLYGPPTWNPPIRLKLVQNTSTRKRKFYTLQVVTDK